MEKGAQVDWRGKERREAWYSHSSLLNINIQFPQLQGFLGSCQDGTSGPATRGENNLLPTLLALHSAFIALQYSVYVISVLYLVSAQAIYNFAPCLRGICSCIEFRDTLCTCKLGAAKYGERVGPATKYSKL